MIRVCYFSPLPCWVAQRVQQLDDVGHPPPYECLSYVGQYALFHFAPVSYGQVIYRLLFSCWNCSLLRLTLFVASSSHSSDLSSMTSVLMPEIAVSLLAFRPLRSLRLRYRSVKCQSMFIINHASRRLGRATELSRRQASVSHHG